MEHKTLFLLDSAPAYLPNMNNLTGKVQVTFMPPNTTSLIQPMDQGVTATFKVHYLWHTCEQMTKFSDGEADPL